ncbi:MAG: tetratricopeptide repeat protein [Pyrinomonadaceae bacterium]
MSIQTSNSLVRSVVACLVLVFAAAVSLQAQTDDETEALAKGLALFQQQQFSEAVPYLETALKGYPNEPKLHFIYGFSLLGKSKQVDDIAQAKQLAEKALEAFRQAKKLGLNDPTNETLIRMLSGSDSGAAAPGAGVGNGSGPTYSKDPQAEKAMMEAESFFARSQCDEAVKSYEKALSLDPRIYEAATGAGDCYVQKSDWENAEKWYQRAIAIDPTRETAYRYSATPLMKQKKYDLARDRYVEAYITEPYNQMSSRGIGQWAQITGAKLGHPEIDIPELSFDAAGKATPKKALAAADPAAAPWLAYIATREAWRREKFAKTFPKDAKYRHTLAEELEALRSAVKAAAAAKSPNKQFDTLARLDTEGLLEAYILLAQPDQDIADGHAEYLKNNRPKLRMYVLNYAIRK